MNYVVVDFEWNQACYGKGSENRKIPFEIIEIGAVKLGHGGGGNAELFLERVDELRELQNGKALDLFDHSSDLFRHCNILLI